MYYLSYKTWLQFNEQNAYNPWERGILRKKFKWTGSIADASKCGRPKTATDHISLETNDMRNIVTCLLRLFIVTIIVCRSGIYPVTVESYYTICTNKINKSHRFHHLYGDLWLNLYICIIDVSMQIVTWSPVFNQYFYFIETISNYCNFVYQSRFLKYNNKTMISKFILYYLASYNLIFFRYDDLVIC